MNPWNAADLQFDVDAFSGVTRLFPLPNLVLYPHVMQPLHIFEDRYREMLEDALVNDRLMAMALLEPGWETDYDSRPPVAEYACLGKIVTHHQLPDGRYNLLLMGVERVRIVRELDPLRSFRQVEVDVVRESSAATSPQQLESLQQQLMAAFDRYLPCHCQVPEQLQEMLAEPLPLGTMTDLAAYALPLDVELKMQLLAEPRVDRRAALLIEQLRRQSADEAAVPMFPPRFSDN